MTTYKLMTFQLMCVFERDHHGIEKQGVLCFFNQSSGLGVSLPLTHTSLYRLNVSACRVRRRCISCSALRFTVHLYLVKLLTWTEPSLRKLPRSKSSHPHSSTQPISSSAAFFIFIFLRQTINVLGSLKDTDSRGHKSSSLVTKVIFV